ncbi:hypothetical protein CRN77_08325 [Proteus vulgaris]|nr:hypothetical protein CRN77_08325 [Proteus vulgaris]
MVVITLKAYGVSMALVAGLSYGQQSLFLLHFLYQLMFKHLTLKQILYLLLRHLDNILLMQQGG